MEPEMQEVDQVLSSTARGCVIVATLPPRIYMFIICAMVFIIAQTADGSYCGDVVIGCGADGDVWGLPTF